MTTETEYACRTTKVDDAVWVTIFLIIIITINMFGAGKFLAPFLLRNVVPTVIFRDSCLR